MGLLSKELMRDYNGLVVDKQYQAPAQRVGYRDFIHWQQQMLTPSYRQAILAFWQEQLAYPPEPLQLPKTKLAKTRNGHSECHLSFSKAFTQQVKSYAAASEASLFACLLSAYQVLLARYSNQTDMIVGVPFFGRNEVEFQDVQGYFINTLPLRVKLPVSVSFDTLIKQNQALIWQVADYQLLSLAELIKVLKLPRTIQQPTLFQTLFNLLNVPMPKLRLAGLKSQYLWVEPGQTDYELAMEIFTEDDQLKLALRYNTALFSKEFIEQLLNDYEQVLKNAISLAKQSAWALPIMSDKEKHKLLVEWNQTKNDYPWDKTIHQLFEEQVERTPDDIAVVFGQQKLTYTQLNQQTNQLAYYLRELGINSEKLVAICLDRSLDLVVGLLGIMKAGGAYVPLDSSYPTARLQFMLEDSQPSVLITEANKKDLFSYYSGYSLYMDIEAENLSKNPVTNPKVLVSPKDLMYVIYTSGSTGQPKGVMNTHQSLVNRITWMQNKYQLKTNDRVLQKTPYSFDVSVWEFFWPLMSGASLIVAYPEIHKSPFELSEFIHEYQISVLHFVPSMLSSFLEINDIHLLCQSVRLVFTSGEALSVKLTQDFFNKLNIELYNLYGPTEAAIDVSYWRCHPDNKLNCIPIGKPIDNIQLYILDTQLQPVPISVVGELYIGGDGLARGYWNRPELTAERFIEHSFDQSSIRLYRTGDLVRYLADGNIEYVGRSDEQVKIRGFRIELGEVEAVLNSYAEIRQSAVIVQTGTTGEAQLIAYVVPNSKEHTSVADEWITHLRTYLRQKLPDYMVPNHFMLLEELPLTANGKLDRKYLSQSMQTYHTQPLVPAETYNQKILVTIWARLLGIEESAISIHDNFFNLGGHSLLIAKMLVEIKQKLQLEFVVRDFMSQPTIAYLAALMEKQGSTVLDWHQQLKTRIEQDAILPDSIQVTAKKPPLKLPKIILLTGASGFIGVHLLKDLLMSTQTRIICLIRAKNISVAQIKLKKQLKKYQLFGLVDLQRVEILLGDLAKPGLGFTEDKMRWLEKNVDSIYHNGAHVHHIYDYEMLYTNNVISTLQLIQLAVKEKNKRLHFISTISAASQYDDHGNTVENVPSDSLPPHFKQGYEQSKWVAEKLVTQAQERGVRASIYRLGMIQGQQDTGIVNEGNHFTLLLKSCIQLGVAPDIAWEIELTPVDIVSQAVVALSLQHNLLPVYHLNNPHTMSWKKMVNTLCEQNYPIALIAASRWQQEYLAALPEDNALFVAVSLYRDNLILSHSHSAIDCVKTQEQLMKLGVHYPKIENKLFATYLHYLMKVGFLPKCKLIIP